MLGAGGIFVVALSAYFGRLPILFWFSILAFATAIWSAAAKSFESFEAARILHGFFSTVAQAVRVPSELHSFTESHVIQYGS